VAKLSFVIFSEQEEAGDFFKGVFEKSGHASVLEVVHDESLLIKTIKETSPDAVLLDLGHAPHQILDLVDKFSAPIPHLVMCGPEDQSDVVLRSLKQGAREFFGSGLDEVQIFEALDRLAQQSATVDQGHGDAPLLAVMGAKGGVGATVVACQLATSLHGPGQKTVIVDLNFPIGDVALNFDVQPTYSLGDIPRASEKIDATLVKSLIHQHESGLAILAAPSRMEDVELVTPAHVEAVLAVLRREYDWVVIDVSRNCSAVSVRALDLANEVLLVTLQDVPTLNHTRAHRDLLLRLGHSAHKIHTIINRHAKSDSVTDEDLMSFLGTEAEQVLPNDYRTTVTCVNEGRSVAEVAPKSELKAAFDSLATQVRIWTGKQKAAVGDSKRGLGGRIRHLFSKEK